jgi:hypothetical protein
MSFTLEFKQDILLTGRSSDLFRMIGQVCGVNGIRDDETKKKVALTLAQMSNQPGELLRSTVLPIESRRGAIRVVLLCSTREFSLPPESFPWPYEDLRQIVMRERKAAIEAVERGEGDEEEGEAAEEEYDDEEYGRAYGGASDDVFEDFGRTGQLKSSTQRSGKSGFSIGASAPPKPTAARTAPDRRTSKIQPPAKFKSSAQVVVTQPRRRA